LGAGLLSPYIALSAVPSNASSVWLPLLSPCLALGDQHLVWFDPTEHLEPPQILPELLAVSDGEDPLVSLPPGPILPALLLGKSWFSTMAVVGRQTELTTSQPLSTRAAPTPPDRAQSAEEETVQMALASPTRRQTPASFISSNSEALS